MSHPNHGEIGREKYNIDSYQNKALYNLRIQHKPNLTSFISVEKIVWDFPTNTTKWNVTKQQAIQKKHLNNCSINIIPDF